MLEIRHEVCYDWQDRIHNKDVPLLGKAANRCLNMTVTSHMQRIRSATTGCEWIERWVVQMPTWNRVTFLTRWLSWSSGVAPVVVEKHRARDTSARECVTGFLHHEQRADSARWPGCIHQKATECWLECLLIWHIVTADQIMDNDIDDVWLGEPRALAMSKVLEWMWWPLLKTSSMASWSSGHLE